VATVVLAVVTVWLANRRSKVHLSVECSLVEADVEKIRIRATNGGDASVVFLRFSWHAEAFEQRRIDLRYGTVLLKGTEVDSKVVRLAKGDILSLYEAKYVFAALADEALPKTADVERAITGSSFACVMTTGESFEGRLPEPVRKALTDRIQLLRKDI
jgi:hypothetical protein